MRRFLASGWYPAVIALLFAGATTGMFAILAPTGEDIGNAEIQRVAMIAGWAVGPVLALLSLLIMGILNGMRRMIKIRRKNILHPIVVLLGLLPWLLFGWQLTMNEPRYTPVARAVIDFAGKEMFMGSLTASLLALLLALPLLFPKKK